MQQTLPEGMALDQVQGLISLIRVSESDILK